MNVAFVGPQSAQLVLAATRMSVGTEATIGFGQRVGAAKKHVSEGDGALTPALGVEEGRDEDDRGCPSPPTVLMCACLSPTARTTSGIPTPPARVRVVASTRSGEMPVLSRDAKAEFDRFMADRGWRVESLDATSAVELMTEFYLVVRAEDVDPAEDGDMLLLQWGDYGRDSFQYDITRQLITNGSCDDDAFLQLSLTLHFEPDATIHGGNRWCRRPVERMSETPQPPYGDSDVAKFRAFMRAAPAAKYVEGKTPFRVTLQIGGV